MEKSLSRATEKTGVSMFALKLFAMLSMLASHTCIVFSKELNLDTAKLLYYFGRMAFPIFAFSIANGWHHTRHRFRYLLRLVILALVSQIPFAVVLKEKAISDIQGIFLDSTLNIGFTFVLAVLGLLIYDFLHSKRIPTVLALAVAAVPSLIVEFALKTHTDYGYKGVILILLMYAITSKPMRALSASVVLAWICSQRSGAILSINCAPAFFMILSLLPLSFYNGERGANVKYMFYIFYPLHLIALFLIRQYLL